MFDKSIAYRLSFYISLAVITVFVVFIVVYFLFNQKLLRENLEGKAIMMNSEVISVINKQIISTKEITGNVALQVRFYSRNNFEENLLRNVIRRYPFITAIQVFLPDEDSSGTNNHYIVYKENAEIKYGKNQFPVFYNESEAELLRNFLNADSAGWNIPYSGRDKNVYISYVFPVPGEGGQGGAAEKGYVMSTLSLTDLSSSINQMLNPQSRGYAFLIDAGGNYLTHPDRDRIMTQNISSLSSKVVSYMGDNIFSALAQKRGGSLVAYPERLNYEKSWVYYSPIPDTGWYIIFVIPHRELFQELYGVTARMLIFAILGIILLFSVIIFITRRQIAPLSEVTSRLSSFSTRNNQNDINTRNEVKQVADSLEFLKNWFVEYQLAREKEESKSHQYRQDLLQASEVQRSLIKTSFPAFPDRKEIDIYAVYKPARVVSGDLFDCSFIDEENLLITIGDVSGKGVPAAIFMSVALTILKNNASLLKPHKIVEKTNKELFSSNQHQYFLTLFLGVLNVRTGELHFCNAAHPFPFIFKQNGNISELKSSHGLPLGLYPDKKYIQEKISLQPGDLLIFYTDGLLEFHQEQVIKEYLQAATDKSPRGILDSLNQLAGKFQQKDDLCMLAVKYTP